MRKIASAPVYSDPLPRSFYERDTVSVAQELIGKIMVRRTSTVVLAGKIVEAEAYLGRKDPCSHAFRGPTPRASIMFGTPGKAYVYFVYGNHFCFNAVVHNGEAGAVLVRALEPVEGIAEMIRRRSVADIRRLTNGPGKLTQAMGITKSHNGLDLITSNLIIVQGVENPGAVSASTRIGVSRGRTKLFRFYLKGNPFVSVPG